MASSDPSSIINKIVTVFLTDGELLRYIKAQVRRRMPPGYGYHYKDSSWYHHYQYHYNHYHHHHCHNYYHQRLMEVIDVVIDEALNDKEIKRLLTHAKLKSTSSDTNNNNNNDDDIIDLSISSSPQSSSPLVLPQYSNSEPLDLLENKIKKTKKHMTDPNINRHRRQLYNDTDNDNDFTKTHSVDKYGRFSSYNNSNNDIDEIDNIINSNNISTASTNDWSRPIIHSFKQQQQDYSNDFDDYDDDDINNKSLNDTSLNTSSNQTQHRRVKFDNNLVSNVFTREKCTREETAELFYTHEEACKFTADYNRECYRAQIEGISWYDWWQNRETDIGDDDDNLEISDDFIVEDIDDE